MFIKK